MRRSLLAALVLGSAAAFTFAKTGDTSSAPPVAVAAEAKNAARPCDQSCSAAWMDSNLTLNKLQQVGTNGSAKQKPEGAVMRMIRMGGKAGAQALDFGHAKLAQQLDSGVRALSFDVLHDPSGGAFKRPAIAKMAMVLHSDEHNREMARPGFKVLYVPDVDYRSSCLTLSACLKQVSAWSKAHPAHLPIVIALRPNDAKTDMPGASTPPTFDAAALTALEEDVRGVIDESTLITPAMATNGWPKLGQSRGKLMLVLDGKAARAYRGSLMFAVREGSPVQVIADPVKGKARIAAAVRSGALVITQADAETREARSNNTARRDAAFASGAQVVLTDFAAADPAIGGYRVSLQDNGRARCGAELGSERCVAILQQRTMTAALP